MSDDANSQQSRQETRKVVERARWAEVTFALALLLYAVLAVLSYRYAYFSWDVTFDLAIQSISLRGFRALMVGISALGSGWLPFALVIVTSIALIVKGCRLEGVICGIEVGVGNLANELFKALIDRPRPAEPIVRVTTTVSHESFPSGHVVFFVEFFGFLIFLNYALNARGRLRTILFLILGPLILLVGISRVYLGAHWPSDVAGAYLAGGVWLMLTIEIYRRLKIRLSKNSLDGG